MSPPRKTVHLWNSTSVAYVHRCVEEMCCNDFTAFDDDDDAVGFMMMLDIII